MTDMIGLTSAQVVERRQVGQGNDIKLDTSRSVKDILVKNVFNPVNMVLYVIGFGMALVGDFKSALATVIIVVFNAAVGIIQELRAKQQLDRIALLARATVNVIRDGQEQAVDPSELVKGDLLMIRAGDQIPVDGLLTGDVKMEVDESALTGESDLVTKTGGDEVFSSTLCMTGSGLVEANGVGEASFANKLTKDARQFKLEVTPLQRNVNQLLRVLLLIVAFFSLLAILALFILDIPLVTWLQIMAVITGSVSASLLALITLNYSWGAVRIGQKGGLVQQINAVESFSNVTVLCTDKTGTLTTNRIQYHDCYPIGIEKAELKNLLADFAASASDLNKTSQAIQDALTGASRQKNDEVAFSSARKWSAIAFDDPGDAGRAPLKGAYVLGALEMLRPSLGAVDQAAPLDQLEQWSGAGLRVLAFAANREHTNLHDDEDEPLLPPLSLLGLIAMSDELRPHLRETIDAFTENGIKLKVISGDNPQTVAALARQAGLPGDLQAVSGLELDEMSPAEFEQTAVQATVFGRITPQQKEALVDALRSRGEYVAMMGDGVNDVLSLKKANLGIAVQSGSMATRSVAAMVLLNDSFEVLPLAFREGQRIVNSIQDILKLFMATVFALLLLIIGISMLDLGFPFTTLQSTLLALFARGLPAFVLAVVATAGLQRNNLLKNIFQFTIPASITIFLFGLLIYIGVSYSINQNLIQIQMTQAELVQLGARFGEDYTKLSTEQLHNLLGIAASQTALTTFFILSGILLMVFARPPARWLAGGDYFDGPKWLPSIVAAVLILAYSILLQLPRGRLMFDLLALPWQLNAGIVLVTILWAAAQLYMWREHLLDRFLDIEW